MLAPPRPPVATQPDEEEKINYRSMGRGHGGVLKKRRRVWLGPELQPTSSAIPTRYETVLHRRNREKQGFISTAPRFASTRQSSSLGPGEYGRETPDPSEKPLCTGTHMGRAGAASGSVGQRGNGCFASRTRRMDLVGHERMPRGGKPPGPGAYDIELEPTGDQPSAAFVPPASSNPAKWSEEPAPGPGDYRYEKYSWTARGPPSTLSAPMAKQKKGLELTDARASTPGPGHYENTPSSPSHVQGPTMRRGRTLAASPGSRLKCGADALSGPPPGPKPLPPGPGDYEPRVEVIRGRTDHCTKGSTAFRIGFSSLPRSWKEPPPGPGHYDGEEQLPQNTGAVASFASASPRFRGRKPSAPGPAYYSPRKADKGQSFLLNAKSNWV